MFLLSIFLTVLSTSYVAHGGIPGFLLRGLEDPEVASLSKNEQVVEAWITQPLDHFNHRDSRTWSMRYLENSGHFIDNGPIFIMIGGEWTVTAPYLEGGLMFEVASDHGGIMYYTEHRYYGKSRPTIDTSTENLQYLNVDQALADLAYFIETKKKDERMKDSPVIIFGGSYAGNMATWFKVKYPHLVLGALASSAPVLAKADFHEYLDVVARSLGKYKKQCPKDVKLAFDAVEELLGQKGGPEKLKEYFNLCEVPNINSADDLALFTNNLAEKFSGVVQHDRFEFGKTRIAACCDNMTASYLGSPLQRLARFVADDDGNCMNINRAKFVHEFKNVSWEAEAAGAMKQWVHQTCTEYGYYQTTNSKTSIFGTLFPLEFFVKLCTDIYDKDYDAKFLDSRVRRTNLMYGGLKPELSNVIFSNGDLDPWHSLSILKDLNKSCPSILIEDSAHCRDLHGDADTDPKSLILARARIRSIIAQWLNP